MWDEVCCTLQSETCAKFSIGCNCVLKYAGEYKVGHVEV